jgi:hypothetical protein
LSSFSFFGGVKSCSNISRTNVFMGTGISDLLKSEVNSKRANLNAFSSGWYVAVSL